MTKTEQAENAFSFEQILHMVLGALMAALMAVGAYIIVPIGPVPIVLQNMFVMLAGLILGPWRGLASVGIYMLAGVLGLPVFSGGGAGLAHIAGPTGGYLAGYLPAVFAAGLISSWGRALWTREDARSAILIAVLDAAAMIAAAAVVYACGVSWLKISLEFSWGKAFAVGMAPFVFGDALKIVAAVPMAAGARRILARWGSGS